MPKPDSQKNKGWGNKYAAAQRDVKKHTTQMDQDANNGKGILKGPAQARGEAVTKAADLKEAARIARKSGGH